MNILGIFGARPQPITLPAMAAEPAAEPQEQDMKISIVAIVQDAERAEKTVIGWLAKEYQEFYKNEPTIERIVDDAVAYAGPALVIILDSTGGAAAAPEVAAIVNEAAADLKIVSALVYDFGATPTAASIAKGVQDNLAALDAAGHIKDPVTTAKLKLIINAVGVVANAIATVAAKIKSQADSSATLPLGAGEPAAAAA